MHKDSTDLRTDNRPRPAHWVILFSVILASAFGGCGGSGEGLDADGKPIGATDTTSGSSCPADAALLYEPTLTNIQEKIFVSGGSGGSGRECVSCHGTSGGLNLESSYTNLVGVPSAKVPTMNRVEPGDPDNSFLIKKLEEIADVNYGARMPANGPPYLSKDEICVVRAWIKNGAENN